MKIELRGITKSYGPAIALDGVNFTTSGDTRILTLVGPSGGGKSTLLRVLGGLTVPDAGMVMVNDTVMPRDPAGLLAWRRRLGFVFQHFNLFPHLSVVRNITLPLEKVHGWTKDRAAARADDMLARFNLDGQAGRMPGQLSGGQAQRVALARALAPAPALLILDEPTSALDPEITSEVLEMILGLARGGQEIILSTHEMGFARALGGTLGFVQAGRVIAGGEAEVIFAKCDHPDVARFFSRIMRFHR
jgi:polar amino acid transport system ATP-binding protein